MRLSFRSQRLAEICNRAASIDRKWGRELGLAIRCKLLLLADLPTLEVLRSFPGVLREPPQVGPNGQLAITVQRNCQIIVELDHDPVPVLRTGELACKRIERLIVVEVNGYGS